MASLIAALALGAAAPQAARPWICARNFPLEGAEGQATQLIDPDGGVSAAGIQVWSRRRGSDARLFWEIPPGSRFARPRYFMWEMEIEPPTQLLWKRYWGDGRFLAQEILVLPQFLRSVPGRRLWSVSTSNPEVLAGWMRAERWEVQLVDGRGASIARETVPLPPASALRSAIPNEVDWLASVIRTRAAPCSELTDGDEQI